ncbi:MAG: FHA domain-containing protein [Pirellulales bacterium]
MYTYLTITVGRDAGSNYLLDPARETRIGRGAECAVMLADGLCSRVHAVIAREDDAWRVRDAGSRNGTFVNGQQVDQAVLADGHHLRVGSTEFAFRQSEQPPTVGPLRAANVRQTLIRDTKVGLSDSENFALSTIQDSEQAKELLLLYQLSIKLLSSSHADELMRTALDLLRDSTGASIVGFLCAGDDGRLKPMLVMPEESAAQVSLSEDLSRLVCREGHAVWIANQRPAMGSDAFEHYADALCVPLVSSGTVLGAIHVYLEQGRFRQSHFDFAISVANITSVALARARKEESLQSDVARLKASLPGCDAAGDRIEEGDLGLREAEAPEMESLRIDHWEQKLIHLALARTSGNVPEAARLLGMGRATLYRKIDEYGISRR